MMYRCRIKYIFCGMDGQRTFEEKTSFEIIRAIQNHFDDLGVTNCKLTSFYIENFKPLPEIDLAYFDEITEKFK